MADRGVIWRYYAFRATNSAGFYLPVAIVFLQAKFDLAFVGLAYAVFSFGMVAAEVPTGYVGDWLGRRGSLAVGVVLRVGVLAAYPFLETQAAFLALHVAWAAGWAFRSGTLDAWLYELLADCCDEDEFARVDGRGSTVVLATSAVAAVLGALLYLVDPALPFLVNAALQLLGLPILYTFPAVATEMSDEEVFTVREALAMLRVQAGRPAIRWVVAYLGLFAALFSVTRTFEQPMLQSVGVPVVGLGVVYAAFKLVSAAVASTAGWFEERLGARGVFRLLVPVYGLAFAAVAVFPVLVVPALFLNRSLSTVTRPIRNQYLNDRLDDVGRATVLSGVSMVLSVGSGTAKLAAGPVAQSMGAVDFLPWAGGLTAVVAAVLWLATSPVRAGGTAPASPGDAPTPSD
ncbi:MFS transporter [Halorarius halobius]|uniref:MFS transporter n=1 Tax=Halorarius halobius TaxID=2962671 RepID=UPI0020CFC137|nr:MFS transporter [Halorarius halobius]